MPRLLELLQSDRPTLCISLIENSAKLAKAVQEAGADGLKVHTNLFHSPSGTNIPSLEREADRLRELLETVRIPVGIVPRGRPGTTRAEVETLREMGFDFIDLYSKNVSPQILIVEGITKWIAPTPDYTPEMLAVLAYHPRIDVIEAAFLPVETFGAPLSFDDIVRLQVGLKALSESSKPLVMPTDRALTTADLPALREIGISNYLLGYAVTGSDEASICTATASFRQALDGW